ncbi:serine/threonine protein kinase [Lachnospiraceae bacterium MD335]|jgi:serine/threonine-protein kinase|nr:serine/threonine protein kinase [Lachnospiraceae bacterium MD335]
MKKFQEICADEFETIKILKRGGQKVVFQGTHKIHGESVIKLYFHFNDPRALREIEIEKTLQLPMVPRILDTGTVEYEGTETLYVIEEKIIGTELRQLLDKGIRFSLQDAVCFLEQGLEFIACIEKEKIVHRDIKPENIIRTQNGKIYFLDFGIARIIGADSLTKTEALMGPHTPGYSAPEQFNNLKKEIDSRADIFSLGVVTYECITGTNPFREGSDNALEVLQKTETITPVQYLIKGDTQSQFMALLGTMMGKYPSRRPKTAEQALGWLKAAKQTFVYD